MDVYVERRMEKKKDKTMTALVVLSALMLSIAIFIILTPLSNRYVVYFIPVLIAAVWYFAYRIIRSTHIEYEILVTNQWFDFDKIIGQKDRKRLIETSIKDFTEFGKYDKTKLNKDKFKTKIYAYNLGDENLYYVGINDRKLGETLLVFSADDELISAIRPHLSRQVKQSAFYN